MSATYFELLKYAATGIASPSMTYYDKMRASTLMGGATVQTLTGIPPLSFKADGKPLISWSVKGNGSQSGTPTPDNPVMPEFVGVRTANLWDPDSRITNQVGQLNWGVVLPAGTYTIKNDSNVMVYYRNGLDATTASRFANAGETATKTTTNDMAVWCNSSQPNIMLNLGSTAIPYEPFGYKIPITCAGQTVPVYLGQVSTVRRIGKLVLDGTESWTKDSDSGQSARYYISVSDIESSTTNLLSTHFSQSTQYGIGTMRGYRKTIIFSVDKTQYPTIADFTAWLAAQYADGTQVTVWYVLATPETAIVNEPLAKIGTYADELHSEDAAVTIPTVKGSNTLTVETELQPSEMTITGRIQENV